MSGISTSLYHMSAEGEWQWEDWHHLFGLSSDTCVLQQIFFFGLNPKFQCKKFWQNFSGIFACSYVKKLSVGGEKKKRKLSGLTHAYSYSELFIEFGFLNFLVSVLSCVSETLLLQFFFVKLSLKTYYGSNTILRRHIQSRRQREWSHCFFQPFSKCCPCYQSASSSKTFPLHLKILKMQCFHSDLECNVPHYNESIKGVFRAKGSVGMSFQYGQDF